MSSLSALSTGAGKRDELEIRIIANRSSIRSELHRPCMETDMIIRWMTHTVLTFSSAAAIAQTTPAVLLDRYPDALAAQLATQQANELSAREKLAKDVSQFIVDKRRWPRGTRILIAFNGGNPKLHETIAAVAREWMKGANFEFDFGYDPVTGKYRSWSVNDTERKAHVQISFDQAGYWSAVGTDSLIQTVFGPGKATMNLEKFSEQWPNMMPTEWKMLVLHEFGHVLGFRHEHQMEACYSEIRWTDGPDPVSQPSVYTVYGKSQGWAKEVIDANFRPVKRSDTILRGSKPEKESCMMYALDPKALKNGTKSMCFVANPCTGLSPGDLAAVSTAYPGAQAGSATDRAVAQGIDKALASLRTPLTGAEKAALVSRAEATVAATLPLLYIQIQRESDRDLGRQIQTAARAAGYFAPGVEDVSAKKAKSGKIPEVRYFRKIDANIAARTAEMLKAKFDMQDVRIAPALKYAKRASNNQIEIWLP